MNSLLKYFVLTNLMLLLMITGIEAGSIPSGYEHINWDSSVEHVKAKYPKGQLGKLAEELIYRQYKPSREIARRNFAFKNSKLHTVILTFDKHYVEKTGIEKLLAEYTKRYGDAEVDRSQAPHMISCIWQNNITRISLAYAPKRPDMTVIIYESKASLVVPVEKEQQKPS